MRIREIQRSELRLKDDGVQGGGGGIHPYEEMLSILHGAAALHWMGKGYKVEAPALFLLPANTPHTLYPASARCQFGYIELEAAPDSRFPNIAMAHAWNELQGTPPSDSAPLWSMLRQSESRLWESFEALHALGAAKTSLSSELLLLDVQKILLLASALLADRTGGAFLPFAAAGKRKSADAQARLQPIIRFMESNYQQPLAVSELAGHARMETNHFIRCFKQHTGTSPLQYLHELRLNAACSFLSTTGMPIQTVAASVGFQHLHYFSRLFKQRFGLSPSAWRAQRQASRGS